MARYKDASCRICRREGSKLFLKGDKCYMEKCPVDKRKVAPGQHGIKRKKLSEYGMQLREKQKTKSFYGILEKQFRKYFEMATNKKGITGENLLQILESRLDNIIYKLGFCSSRAQARLLINQGHFKVNGVKVNIPSFLVKPNDVIEVKENSKAIDKIRQLVDSKSRAIPEWLDLDAKNLSAKVVRLALREDIDLPVEEHLIVELYSK